MRWHVAVAMGLVAWGAYSLTRTRSASTPVVLEPHPGENGHTARVGLRPLEEDSLRPQREDPSSLSEKAPPVRTSALIRVSWNVRVPEETPPDDFIYICGNHPALGHWNPMGVALHPVENGVYRGDLRMPAGTTFEYKFTRGTWKSVEVLKNGADRPNRILDRNHSGTIESDVEAWADLL